MHDFLIVLPTHSNYCKITENFLELLKKNWKDCPFDVIVSITGEDVKLDRVRSVYNGKNASLIDCLVNVSKKYKSNYYISFLGDAFINKAIDNTSIMKILDELADSHADYCSLKYVKEYKKEKKYNQHFRYINDADRYSHNFTAFAVSYDYMNNEMIKFKDDLEFETKYLSKRGNDYYDDHLIVRGNYFNLLPGIVKGKWDAINYRKLKKDNPEIQFEDRLVLPYRESALRHIRNVVVSHLPTSLRVGIKKSVEKTFGFKFGVDG